MKDIQGQATEYWNYAYWKCNAHIAASEEKKSFNGLIGVPAIVISAGVGTGLLATHKGASDTAFEVTRTVAVLCSFCAAALSAIQTFFRFSEVAEKHRLAGVSYEGIMRQLDLFLLEISGDTPPAREKAITNLKKISDKMSDIAAKSPSVPEHLMKKVEKKLQGSFKDKPS